MISKKAALFLRFSLGLGLVTGLFGVSFAGESKSDEPFNAKEVIMHHIADSHEFHILGEGEKSVSMPLPIILWTKSGLVSFLSSEFHHDDDGKVAVVRNGQSFLKFHDKVYYSGTDGSLEFDGDGHPTNDKPLDFSITKNVFSMLMSVVILSFIFIPVASSYKKNNGLTKGVASFIEPLVLFVRDDIAIPNIGEKKYAKYLPYLLTVFFFIWINNLIGLIPFFPFSSNLTGNIAFTLTMSAFTLIITNFSGNKYYWKHMLLPDVPLWLYPIMVPVELSGIISKPFALMIRLFANISAGHIIILSLTSLIFIFKTVWMSPVSIAFVLFMNVLELLVAALQAYIFTLLTALFIGTAVADHEHH